MIAYFNEHILKERHSIGSLEGGSWFIKTNNAGRLSLRSMLLDFEKNDVDQLKEHDFVYDDSLTANY